MIGDGATATELMMEVKRVLVTRTKESLVKFGTGFIVGFLLSFLLVATAYTDVKVIALPLIRNLFSCITKKGVHVHICYVYKYIFVYIL